MEITASLVKELRERTGAGMMDCKKALTEADGDIETAIENMRKSGMAKAAKKAGRVAAEGIIIIQQSADGKQSVILETNCETDFVAKDENFTAFANTVAGVVLKENPSSVDDLLQLSIDGKSIEDQRTELVAKIGENISIRRFMCIAHDGTVGSYLHGVRIGVVVELTGGDDQLAKDIAMHIAASKPVCVKSEDVPEAMLEKEKAVFRAQAEESGKPADIIEKMVSGRVNKFLKEVTLLGQPFVKDPDMTVEKLLNSHNATVNMFVRYEVGEGVEKKEDNFVEEVMAQAKGSD
ncbi:MAG: elongation factor Ts [Gammaproteobacteria bacterium]|nr:elongation factor Ts [Gammaproteobacteria bacterium]